MKPTNILLALSLVLASSLATHAQVGIGTSSPNAALDVTSTTQGFLPPRMTTTQRDAISSPAVGLVIFNTTTNCLNFYAGYWIESCGTGRYPSYSVFCASGAAAVVDVLNPTTNKTWMDRNLGASQVATSSTDANSYGDLYQWGRRSDGHQCRNSGTTSTLSSVDEPAHGSFITASSGNADWRDPQNANLWQGVSGVNNPCPSGYRIPTGPELSAELASWSQTNSVGALASPLKLPLAGTRDAGGGSLTNVGTVGNIHSSTINGTGTNCLSFSSSNSSANVGLGGARAFGWSVRCIKN